MAKVKVVKNFASLSYVCHEGDIIELPHGVDWLKAGLVEKIPVKRKRKETK